MTTPQQCSTAALESARLSAPTQRARILLFLQERGAQGATDDEIQATLGLSGDTERPRRQELETRHLVMCGNDTRPTRKGKPATVWYAQEGVGVI